MDLHNVTAAKEGRTTKILVHNNSVVNVRVGSENMQDRKWVIVQNQSNANIAFSFLSADGSTPSVAQVVKQGIRIAPGNIESFPLSENVDLFACSVNGTGDALSVSELA